MKSFIAVIAAASLTLCAGTAAAFNHFAQNEFMTADSLDPGLTQTGVNFTVGDHYKSYYPEVRYGLGAFAEIGVKFGVTAVDYPPDYAIGALGGLDLKYQLIKESEGVPLDMAVDLGFDNTLVSNRNVSEVKFSTVFSKGYPLTDRGYKFTPYGGLEMSSLYGSYFSEGDIALFVFGGFEWKVSQKFMILMEVKTGDSTMGGAGVRFEY